MSFKGGKLTSYFLANNDKVINGMWANDKYGIFIEECGTSNKGHPLSRGKGEFAKS